MKKQFLSLLAAGLMLSGVSQINAMENPGLTIAIKPSLADAIITRKITAMPQNTVQAIEKPSLSNAINTHSASAMTPQNSEQIQKEREEKARAACWYLSEHNHTHDIARIISLGKNWVIVDGNEIPLQDENGAFHTIDIYREKVKEKPNAIIATYPISPIGVNESFEAYQKRLDREKMGFLKNHKNYLTLERLTDYYAHHDKDTEGWHLRDPHHPDRHKLMAEQKFSHDDFYWGPANKPNNNGWKRARKKALETMKSLSGKSTNENHD